MNMMRSAVSALFLVLTTQLLPAQALLTGPNTLNFTATANGPSPSSQSIAIRHTGDTARTFTLSIATLSGGNWLSVSAGGGTTPSRITVSANSAGLPAGTYQGNIQIASPGSPGTRVDINLTVTGTNVLQASPSSLLFARQTGTEGAVPEQYILVNTTGSATNYTVTSTTSDGGSWLIVSATPSTTPGLIAVRVNTTGLAPGNYSGSITIAAQGLTTIVAPVGLSIGVNPIISTNPPEVRFAAVRTGSAATAQVSVQTSSGVAAFSATATTATGGSWLIVEPQISSAPSNIVISANPVGLAAGTYSGTVTITAAAAQNPTTTLPVTFTVTDSPVVNATPRTLALTIASNVTGQSNLIRELPAITLSSTVANTAVTTTTVTANGGSWLSAGTVNGTAPGTVTAVVDATGLNPGVYIGQITVQGPGNSVAIPVTLTVTAGSAEIAVDPPAIVFNYQKGQTPPSNQIVNVLSSGAALPYQSTITSITPPNNAWLAGAVTTGSTPGSATLGVNAPTASTLANGQYTATVSFGSAPGASPAIANPATLNVTLNVADTALFNVSPAVLDFAVPLNGPAPAPRAVAITATDASARAFTVATSTTSGGSGWLLIGATAGITPSNLNVQVSPLGLSPGVYEGTIQITVPTISNTAQIVRVRMTIQSNVALTANPTGLTFTQASGASAPPAQSLTIAAPAGVASFQVSASTASGGNWLTVSPTGGTTPQALSVSVNGTGLAPGTYTGSIAIVAGGVNNSPLQIPVVFTVGAPTLAVTPTSISWTATPGVTTTLTQNLTINGAGQFTATVNSSPVGWLSVAPVSGTSPSTITVTANPGTLSAGTYTGTVVITVPGLANSPISVPVTLTVAAVAPAGRQVIAQIADGGGWKTTITLVNLDAVPANFRLRFFASDGSLLRLPFEGGTPGRLEEISGIIPVGGSRTIVTAATDTALSQGWAELTSAQAIGGQGVFRQRVPNRPDQEAGVSAILPSSRFMIPYDNTQGFVSSMAIANTNLDLSRSTTVTPRIEDGTALLADSVNLPARGQTAFAFAERFPSMAGRRGTADFTSTGADFAALGLRFNNSGAFTSLPALDVPLTAPTAEITRVISQVAEGGGWKTLITLVNLDSAPAAFAVRFFRADGAALTLPLTGSSPSEVIEGTIPVGGTRVIETLGGESALVQGWAQLTTSRNVSGVAVFRQRVPGRTDQEAAVTLTATNSRFVLPFDNTGEFTTAMALVNSTATLGSTISVVIRDEAGVQIATDSISLGGRGYASFALTARFAQTVGRRGTLEFSSSTQITGLGLRFNQNGAFTSFPVMPKR
jgi:hypothetical protein